MEVISSLPRVYFSYQDKKSCRSNRQTKLIGYGYNSQRDFTNDHFYPGHTVYYKRSLNRKNLNRFY
jgi:hypothetical protein